jgi:hypothetical protein
MIDLDYADTVAPAIPAERVITIGRRLRRRRRIAGGGSMFLMVAAIAWAATVMIPQTGSAPAPFDPVPDKHRPSDPVVIVGTPIAGWRAFVFRSTDDLLCMGSAAYGGPDEGRASYGCETASVVITPGTWVQKPEFQGAPFDGSHVLAIGLVRGPATTVTLDFLGHKASAPVVPVSEPGWAGLGAYCLWLPTYGTPGYGTPDVSDVEAWDRDGRLVTSLP